jgi:Protein of unknown function (DUF1493)
MSEEIFEKLKKFIVEQRWEYDFPLVRTTAIEKDLGITGDDSDDFLIAFGKEFNVDVSRLPIGDYFSSEGDPILPAIIRILTGKKKKQNKVLTIGHLEKAILAGRLDEEIIGSR